MLFIWRFLDFESEEGEEGLELPFLAQAEGTQMRAQGRASQVEHLAETKDSDGRWYKTKLAGTATGQIFL